MAELTVGDIMDRDPVTASPLGIDALGALTRAGE